MELYAACCIHLTRVVNRYWKGVDMDMKWSVAFDDFADAAAAAAAVADAPVVDAGHAAVVDDIVAAVNVVAVAAVVFAAGAECNHFFRSCDSLRCIHSVILLLYSSWKVIHDQSSLHSSSQIDQRIRWI
jgi:hypothetical protein